MDLRKWLLNPAILLALVPLIKFGIEFVLRRLFGQTALTALNLASQPGNAQPAVQTAIENEEVRKALAQFVENSAQLEDFIKIMVFASLSLIAWNLIASKTSPMLGTINILLIAATIALLLYLAIRLIRGKAAPGRKDATRKLIRTARGLDFAILVFEAIAKGLEHSGT
jgi:hypothetical protein